MPWFYVDDGFSDSKPVLNMPDRHRLAACGLWVLAGSWSAKEELDGFVPDSKLRQLGARPPILAALTEPGPMFAPLCEKLPTGIQFNSWSKWQKTRADLNEKRREDAERQRAWREAHPDAKPARKVRGRNAMTRSDDGLSQCDNPVTNDVTNSVTNSVTDDLSRCDPSRARARRPDPTRPDPTLDIEPTTANAVVGRATASRDRTPPMFTAFWDAYPRRRDRRKAEKAFLNAVKRADPEVIIAGAIRYATDPNREDQFTKYAEGWLNGDGWLDEPLPNRISRINGNHVHVATSDLRVAQVQALKNRPERRLEIE